MIRSVVTLLLTGFLVMAFRRSSQTQIPEQTMKSEKLPEPPNWSQMDVTSPQFRLACLQVASDLAANWKFKAQILFAVFVLIFAVAALIFGIIGYSASEQAKQVEDHLKEQIAEKMREPKIQKLIEEEARKEASALMKDSIQPKIDAFQEKLHRDTNILAAEVLRFRLKLDDEKHQSTKTSLALYGKVRDLAGLVTKYEITLKENQELARFLHVMIGARLDDRSVINDLRTISESQGPNSAQAKIVISQILSDGENNPYIKHHTWGREWLEVEEANATLADFEKASKKLRISEYYWFFRDIWRNERFAKSERIKFFMKSLDGTDSIAFALGVCSGFKEDCDIKEDFLNFDAHREWLAKELAKEGAR